MIIKKIKNADLKKYNSFHVGGKADIYYPKNIKELKFLIEKFNKNKIKYIILGNGTNILFTDNFKQKIISMSEFSHIYCQKNVIFCESGVNLFKLNIFCAENNLTGLEFSYGIPASVGGAIKMNAGAFGDEICNHLISITVLKNGVIYEKKNFDFSYRKGPLEDDEILIFAKIQLNYGKNQEILAKMNKLLKNRKNSQPYDKFSAGSVFKRQGEVVPAKLIDEWGLKGIKIGGAQISEKHAGFIVSDGSASASDIISLIEVIERVANNHGYHFEREIKIV